MMFWTFAAMTAVLTGLWMARPYLRRGAVELNDSDGAISVFRDQLDEVERDLSYGLINAGEHDATKREI